MTSAKLSAISVDEEKKSRRCFLKESSILSKRIVGAKRENRRFFLKESSVLMGSKSIYFQISLNCYAVGDSNTGQNIVKS